MDSYLEKLLEQKRKQIGELEILKERISEYLSNMETTKKNIHFDRILQYYDNESLAIFEINFESIDYFKHDFLEYISEIRSDFPVEEYFKIEELYIFTLEYENYYYVNLLAEIYMKGKSRKRIRKILNSIVNSDNCLSYKSEILSLFKFIFNKLNFIHYIQFSSYRVRCVSRSI